MQRKWFGREPALIVQGVAALLAVLLAWQVKGLNDHIAAAVTALLVMAAATYTALYVQPWAPSIFGGLIGSGATLLASFGLHYTQTQTATVTVLVASLVALLTRAQQTPIPVGPGGG